MSALRDIKPDNILLDAQGHAHLTDFNVAIHYSDRRNHTSIAGSMAYMAPQVIGRKGYSWQVDWWSLGITAYELLFHKRPFDGRNSERMTQSILKDTLKFPEDASLRCSDAGIAALKGVSTTSSPQFIPVAEPPPSLLNVTHKFDSAVDLKDKVSRTSEPIRGSVLLTGIFWIARKRNLHSCLMYVLVYAIFISFLTSPHSIKSNQANFDVSHELDEFLMVEKPLTHTKRKANADLDKLRPELRQLEEQYVNHESSFACLC